MATAPETASNHLRLDPLFVAGFLWLVAGALLGVYNGLAWIGLASKPGWLSWSHTHYVTIGAVTQLVLAMLPQLAARKLGQPAPPRWYARLNFVLLNGGFLVLWYGRGWGQPLWFDLGLYTVFALVLGLFVFLLRLALRSDRGWDASVGLWLASPFVFMWGITYAYGLFAHVWSVPGGWLGLREAHVHANAWGFLAFAAVGTIYLLFPRLLRTDLYSERLRDVSVWLFLAGIFPLITGPWLGMGRSITATGLVLYATGFALYLYNLVRTYRGVDAENRSGAALTLLVSQFWLLGPAGFAPFVLFGIEWVKPAYIEQGALHFFFVGWALPIVLVGVLLYARTLPCPRMLDAHDDPPDAGAADGLFPAFDRPRIPRWAVAAWNLAVLLWGVGFFYQEAAWAAVPFAVGASVVTALWLAALAAAVAGHWGALRAARTVEG